MTERSEKILGFYLSYLQYFSYTEIVWMHFRLYIRNIPLFFLQKILLPQSNNMHKGMIFQSCLRLFSTVCPCQHCSITFRSPGITHCIPYNNLRKMIHICHANLQWINKWFTVSISSTDELYLLNKSQECLKKGTP